MPAPPKATAKAARLISVWAYEQHIQRDGGVLFHSFQAWQRGDILLRAGQARQCLNLIARRLIWRWSTRSEPIWASFWWCVPVRCGRWRAGCGRTRTARVISTAMALAPPRRLAAAHQLALLLRERGQFTLAQEALAQALLRGVEADRRGAPVLARVQTLQQAFAGRILTPSQTKVAKISRPWLILGMVTDGIVQHTQQVNGRFCPLA